MINALYKALRLAGAKISSGTETKIKINLAIASPRFIT